MIEQSVLYGQVYLSIIKNKTLISKPVSLTTLKFGPMRPITIFLEDEFVLVQNNITGDISIYKDNLLQGEKKDIRLDQGFFYYYGVVEYTDKKTNQVSLYPYYLQNKPLVTIDTIPNTNTFELPRTLQPLDYNMKFTYPDIIYKLLSDVPATYVDTFKRPIIRNKGRIYPINIDDVKTTIKDLPPTTYPITFQLVNTSFAVVDLEPNYTTEDFAHFESIDGFYIEDTPRGGKHLLVLLDSDVTKFRYSQNLEIINESQVTLYGINAKQLNVNPKPLDVSSYKPTKTHLIVPQVKPIDEDLSQYVKLLNQKNKKAESSTKDLAKQKVLQDDDQSHGDYMALYILYHEDIKPYEQNLPKDLLPWILEAYARDVIPWREKHETMRKNVPYLVHLANIIIFGKTSEI